MVGIRSEAVRHAHGLHACAVFHSVPVEAPVPPFVFEVAGGYVFWVWVPSARMPHAIIYNGRAEEEGDNGGAYLVVRLVYAMKMR